MTIRLRLLIEFGVSVVLGTALCLAVSAYVAGTSSATRAAATTDTSSDPIVHIVAYSGMGFAVATTETTARVEELRRAEVVVHDRKNAGTAMEGAMDLLRDRAVTMGGRYGWPVLFGRWTSVGGELRGVHAWGPTRAFEIEPPPPPGGAGGGGGAGAGGRFGGMFPARTPPKTTLTGVPSYMLPTELGHIDFGMLAVSVSVYVVGCWIVIHLLIELVRAVLGFGAKSE